MTVKQRIAWGIVGMSVLMALGLHYRARSRPLPEGCTAALVFDSDISTSYWWLSDSVALLCRYGSWNRTLPAQGRFSLFNRVAHTETPLPELTAALLKNRMQGDQVELSADRRWVLWKNQKWPLPRIGDATTYVPRYEVLTKPPTIGAEGGPVYDTKMVIKARPVGKVQAAVQTFQIDLPENRGTEGAVLTQGGDKIAWFMGSAPPLPEICSALGLRNDAAVRLWMSAIDGSRMRELGYVSCSFRYYYDNIGDPFDGDPSDLQWLPDGKHLSFVLNHTLYVMSVE